MGMPNHTFLRQEFHPPWGVQHRCNAFRSQNLKSQNLRKVCQIIAPQIISPPRTLTKQYSQEGILFGGVVLAWQTLGQTDHTSSLGAGVQRSSRNGWLAVGGQVFRRRLPSPNLARTPKESGTRRLPHLPLASVAASFGLICLGGDLTLCPLPFICFSFLSCCIVTRLSDKAHTTRYVQPMRMHNA